MASSKNFHCSVYGERAILVEWPHVISEKNLYEMLRLKSNILKKYADQIIDVVVAYNSLTIYPDLNSRSLKNWMECFEKISFHDSGQFIHSSRTWKIPVCYDEYFGLDLSNMSKSLNIGTNDIIRLHSGVNYLVYFVGFLPGFLYLGGLNKRIHFPRRSRPRPSVSMGTVAIGGEQTGIYPMDSPAGWNILGRTPVKLFNAMSNSPTFAKSGDYIKFEPIDLEMFRIIEESVKLGTYEIAHV